MITHRPPTRKRRATKKGLWARAVCASPAEVKSIGGRRSVTYTNCMCETKQQNKEERGRPNTKHQNGRHTLELLRRPPKDPLALLPWTYVGTSGHP